MLSMQEAYTKVRNHMLAQMAKSVDANGDCAYRGEGGLKCAIGCLIPDEAYDPKIEGIAVASEEYFYAFADQTFGKERADATYKAFRAAGIFDLPENGIRMLKAMQAVHDLYAPGDWKERLDSIASRFYVEVES